MKIIDLLPSQIITLNDYPVHSASALIDYFSRCKLGESMPFVPVIRKDIVRKDFDDQLLEEFERYEHQNTVAEYFMLDGSHRTTALTLAGCKIKAIIYGTDSDIADARKLVLTNQILKSETLGHSLEENCKILYRHFKEKPYFMNVGQKMEKMKMDKKLPLEILNVIKN